MFSLKMHLYYSCKGCGKDPVSPDSGLAGEPAQVRTNPDPDSSKT